MTIKASAGSALILAAGLLVGFAGPLPAIAAGTAADSAEVSKSESATSGKSARTGSRYLKKRSAYRKSTPAASKSTESKKADEKQVADASGSPPPAMPEWLANANAQMTSTDAAPDTAKAMSAAMSEKANTVLQQAAEDKPADAEAPADAAVVASDQLNDVDRALQEETPSTQTVAMASAKSASEAPDQAASSDSSTLDKTSLIGKIFIAFGALLTMASAARMFMA
ncbi:hypothetical protein GWE18_00120 [Bradyrhizobium sp. CSA112]|uniref:hypothetical protein n=1 Tax=Bradyrhizobium sp. CSA112 TaxID=2699170 RepID=UPI0023B0D2D6|nr:hypothetical protein [Bradyrhizobium sp. CSA112]MDE5451281.1 hypothetical protein [Bradyrhizobium sp. CSA112]